ncbi:rhodanese-like domain-containing protein [Microbacterium sp. BWT-B31]|uniref:rhodanese-like domain-containing protein n=1 Tax=Microbacterium sp. BWT-B31 TaxID=3232072 RepID=UPI00352968C0
MSETTPTRVVNNTAQLIDAEAAEARRASGAVFLDVRRPRADRPQGDIEGAIKVDKATADELIDPGSASRIDALAAGADTEIVVFCNSEFGSDPVVEKLNGYGYTNVRHVRGGFVAWTETGLPVVGTDVADGGESVCDKR